MSSDSVRAVDWRVPVSRKRKLQTFNPESSDNELDRRASSDSDEAITQKKPRDPPRRRMNYSRADSTNLGVENVRWSDLPEGILLMVFEELFKEPNGRQLVSLCGQVCKGWHDDAMSVLLGDTAASRRSRCLKVVPGEKSEELKSDQPTSLTRAPATSAEDTMEDCSSKRRAAPIPPAHTEKTPSAATAVADDDELETRDPRRDDRQAVAGGGASRMIPLPLSLTGDVEQVARRDPGCSSEGGVGCDAKDHDGGGGGGGGGGGAWGACAPPRTSVRSRIWGGQMVAGALLHLQSTFFPGARPPGRE